MRNKGKDCKNKQSAPNFNSLSVLSKVGVCAQAKESLQSTVDSAVREVWISIAYDRNERGSMAGNLALKTKTKPSLTAQHAFAACEKKDTEYPA
jgi:hypothetical protein